MKVMIITRADGRLYHFHYKELLRYVSGGYYQQYPTYLKYLGIRQKQLLDVWRGYRLQVRLRKHVNFLRFIRHSEEQNGMAISMLLIVSHQIEALWCVCGRREYPKAAIAGSIRCIRISLSYVF